MANKRYNSDLEVQGTILAESVMVEGADGNHVLMDNGETKTITQLFDTSNFVTTNTDQTVNGIKYFTQSISTPGINLNTGFGSGNGIFNGNADGADFNSANVDIKSWWGIGFVNTSGAGILGRTIVLDTRAGSIHTQGEVYTTQLNLWDSANDEYGSLRIFDNTLDISGPYGRMISYERDASWLTLHGSSSNVSFAFSGNLSSVNLTLPSQSGTLALVSDLVGNYLKLTGTGDGEYIDGYVLMANGEDQQFYTWDGDNGAKIYWPQGSRAVGLDSTTSEFGTVKIELKDGKATYSSSGITGILVGGPIAGKIVGEVDGGSNAVPGGGTGVAPRPFGADKDYSPWYGNFDFTQKGYIVENFVDLFTSQEIEGVKYFTDTVQLFNPLELYDGPNDGFGTISLSDDIYQFKSYSGRNLLQYDYGNLIVNNAGDKFGTLKFNNVTDNRTYTFPDKSGTVALMSDIGDYMTKVGTQNVSGNFNIRSIDNSGFKIDSSSNYPVMYWGNTQFSVSDDAIFGFYNGAVEITGSGANLFVSGDIVSQNNGSASKWGTSIYNRGALVDNVDFASVNLATGYYANETPNGTNNTNQPTTGYGVFQRIKSQSFTFDMMAYNHGDLYFKSFYHPTENGTATPWRKVITDQNLPTLQQIVVAENPVEGAEVTNAYVGIKRNLASADYLFSVYSDNATTAKWGQFVIYQETDGYLNVYSALRSTNAATPSLSTYYGFGALRNFPKSATSTSTRHTAFGYRAGYSLTSGNNNNFYGGGSGNNVVTANGCTIIGSYSFPANTTLTNHVVISDGTNTRIVFQTTDTGLTTIPAQTNAQITADTTGKAVVTKEYLAAFGGQTYTAGTGISIAGNVITNSAPNIVQTLSISGSTITLSNGGGSVTAPNTTYTNGSNLTLTGTTFAVASSPTFSGSVTATAFYESSLRKYKENIKPFEKSGLDLIDSLEIVTFDKIDGPKDKIGIILDDSPKDFASESGEEVDLYKTIFIQAKAIQELRAEIEILKSKIK